MSSIQVLLVEDDMDLANTIIQYCELEDIICDHANNGASGLELATRNRYQTLILDINMPRMTGLELCQTLRDRGDDTPILMLTARDTIDDKLAGFEAGSDDYLIKPFELRELVARIKTLSKRRSGEMQKLEVADLSMDLKRRQASRGNVPIKLSPIGWKLLETLMRASPGVVSRQALEEAVWGDEPPDSNSLKVHMHHLRTAVDKPFDQPLIHTVISQGFALRINSDDEEQQ